MRFASLNNSNASDYAVAGKEGAKGLRDNFAIMRQTGPRYDELSEAAMRTRSAEKVAALEAQARVGEAGVRAMGTVAKSGIEAKADTADAARKGERIRKAGKLAAVSGVLSGAAIAAFGNEKDDLSEREALDKRAEELNRQTLAILSRPSPYAGVEPFQPGERPPAYTPTSSTGSGAQTTTPKPQGGSAAGVAVDLNGSYSGGTLNPEDAKAIRQTANYLQLDPYEFGGLIEMESSHRPNVWGGAGGNYKGLIQFGPGARKEVGLPNRDMTIAEQMPYVQRYFDQRGFKPGQHNITHAYRTVLVGNPYESGTDSWDTNSDEAAKRMMPGGDLYEQARKRYGTWTPL